MENKNDIFSIPLASFTFGKDNQKMGDIINNPLISNIKSPSDLNQFPIQSSMSQDYFQTSKFNNKYNTTKSNNYSGSLKKMIEFNKNNDNINNYNNNFYNTNQSAKIINSNYGGEFTFGQNSDMRNINDINNNQNDGINFFNNSFKNNYRNYNDINNNSLKNNPVNYSLLTNNKIFRPIFVDESNNENNSYILVILHSIINIKPLFNYILSITTQNFPQQDHNILLSIKDILLKIKKSQNGKINIRKLKENLSFQFKNRRKFILNYPDDPVDLLFTIFNSLHSYVINSPLNEISDELCNNKCFSHKNMWLDLTRIDECGCNATSRRLFSNHNYITDIPMNKIFYYINNLQKNPKYNIIDINQKLFIYYKEILKNFVMNCPMNGSRCNINKVQHRLFLANSPTYFIFNLDYNETNFETINFNSILSLDILKSFILISKTLEINMIFEENTRNKNEYNINKKYNLFGIVFISLTKIYSCAFYHQGNNNSYFYYYKGNNNYINFNSFYNLVLFSLKNGNIPLILFYQENSNDKNDQQKEDIEIKNNELLSREQIIHLEKYCNNIDNFFNTINNNKIRTNENILNILPIKNNINNQKPSLSQNTHKVNKNKPSTKMNQIVNQENNNINENSLKNRNNQFNHSNFNNKSVQSQNNYINNNYYIQNNMNNTNEIIDDYSDKKYSKIKFETDVKSKVNKMPKSNIEEYSSNLWDMPTPYMPYKKEEPITIIPIQNQNSLDVKNTKGKSENYFYKNNKNQLMKENNNNNINMENMKKNELKQKSNSYSKKHGPNFKSLINSNGKDTDVNNNNSENVNNIKRRIINNLEYAKNKVNKNPNSFNKNHNLRNINDEAGRKYALGKIHKSNFDLSANNRPTNITYDKNSIGNNISNISSSNQNFRNISDEMIPSDDIKKRFKNKKIINHAINFSNKNRKMRKNRINYIDKSENINSKSDDNMNSNIYNFNYIYNNNNFDMNILENNLDNNNYNYKITDDRIDKRRKIEKIKKNLNINNISNLNNNNNNSFLTEDDKSIRNQNQNIKTNLIGQWICQYCSNINRDDFMYCKICRRNKSGKILRINTQLLKINQKQKKIGNKNIIKGGNYSNNTTNNKKNQIPKGKKIINNSNRVNIKNSIKKMKRNTLIGFSSSKNFNIENYENFISNQNKKTKEFNTDEIKKEYSFTKPSFNNRKYKIY